MTSDRSPELSPASRRTRLLWGLAALVPLLGLSALAAWRWNGGAQEPATTNDPRLTFSTPYRNVRPEVRFVGDEVCARCHPREARTYRRHPMGRSFAPMAEVAGQERYDAAAHNPFPKFGFDYLVERHGERVYHKETRRADDGRLLIDFASEVHYAMGSGTRGRSYLINHDGYLFQSPISWFAQSGTWDLSPGYSETQHFERPIEAQCLFCHANDADPVEHTRNRYRTPLFRSHAIGCERCHGPGELHIASRQQGELATEFDDTIVNPGRLEPSLREAVCQQCHLQGEKRILRRGRQPFDYRPGLPLHLFWSVFVRIPDLIDGRHAVGQVEQMYASRCFRASDGRLGCISCHDPHAMPAPEETTAYYRGRCLTCHAEHGCRLAIADRRVRNQDDCRACHMPRNDSSDIAHTAVTDHRILRKPAPKAPPEPPRPLAPGENPLAYFHQDLQDPHDHEVSRDLGLALIELARQHGPRTAPLGSLALPLLEGAVHRAPDDVAAWEAKGYALWLQGQATDALDAFEAALSRAPVREQSLNDAALLAEQRKQPDRAISYWRRVIAVNPWVGFYRYQLARLLADRRDWSAALAECRAVLRLNPASKETRLLQIRCHLGLGEQEQARAELATLLALQPRDPDALRRWFDEQTR
jgi:Tfp pilus assembly protein PilF